MSRQAAGLILALIVLVTLSLAAVLWWRRPEPSEPDLRPELEDVLPTAEGPIVNLYFPGSGGKLFGEQRELPLGIPTEDRLRMLLEELLKGPQDEELYPPFPADTKLGWVLLTAEGLALVDLEMPGESAHPDWGSRQEMLAIYSLVDTVLLNLPNIKAVTLLRNGQQAKTFAGHVDTTHPLVANRNLLATRTR